MVIRGIFFHACAWTAVQIATVHSHPGDTHGKREGHMRDTFQGRDTIFSECRPLFSVPVSAQKRYHPGYSWPPPGCHGGGIWAPQVQC